MAHQALALDSVWLDKYKFDDAEENYQKYLNRAHLSQAKPAPQSSLVDKIAQARQQIKNSLQSGDTLTSSSAAAAGAVQNNLQNILRENVELKKAVQDLTDAFKKLETRVGELEKKCSTCPPAVVKAALICPAKEVVNHKPTKDTAADDDDDVDLFGSEEDEEADKAREERLKAYHEKKSKKPQVVAKSSIVLDVKPWDDETNMKAMEEQVRNLEMDGLLWGASKLVPLAYGINKLQIVCVVEDDKVGIDDLQEHIEGIDIVQSVDIAAFNKI
uniref:Putative elongation factor 1 beta/delta chain ixodes scapularis elongation factor 1 beta/delta chain n=1 Tax=Ornithodoros turicata TaxID=34597 RepID=A0A2R5LCA8_9ACAR